MTAIAFGRPLATGFVPSRGSTAMWTSGPSPRPPRSPMKGIGAPPRSPSPMAFVPLKRAPTLALRVSSSAAWSASLVLPWYFQRAAAIAAASVMRTSSRLGVRSAGIRSSGGVPWTFMGGVTLVRNPRPRTHQALRCVFDERQGFSHRLRDRHTLPRDGDRVESKRLMSRAQTARDRNDRHAGAPCGRGHRTGELPVPALLIDASLAGHHQIRARDALGESDRAKHELRTGDKTRVEEREEARAEAPGRSRAGHVADRPTDEGFYDVRVPRECGIELADDLGCRALLRAIHRGRALWTEERIANVARDLDRGTDQARVGLAIDAAELRERGTALGEIVAVAIEESVAEGARHPRASVVRGAAADADHDPMSAARGRREDELPRPPRARDARVAFGRSQQRKPARRGHLHHRRRTVAEDAPLRIDLATQRIVHARSAQTAVRRGDERAPRPLAAIGERDLLDSRVRPRTTDAARDRGGDGDRIGGAFARLGGDDEPRRAVSMHRGIL